ncbi:MAG: hypothetical protein IJ300_01560 [Clostridia bacterium]|nr:hypothetical protein [Clostridia bacterium]
MGFDREKLSAKFENIILLEMKRRGYDVNIGKNNTKEIDFVGVRRDENIYPSLCGTPYRINKRKRQPYGNQIHYHKMIF